MLLSRDDPVVAVPHHVNPFIFNPPHSALGPLLDEETRQLERGPDAVLAVVSGLGGGAVHRAVLEHILLGVKLRAVERTSRVLETADELLAYAVYVRGEDVVSGMLAAVCGCMPHVCMFIVTSWSSNSLGRSMDM